MALKKRSYVGMTLGYFVLVCVITFVAKYTPRLGQNAAAPQVGRKLLNNPLNCTPRSVEEFPEDFMTLEEKKKGGVVVHILIALYLFVALAMVCDDSFVPALERICEVMHLKPDVAGATFMAAGSSAPELFTSVIGVFIAKSDVGVSTIVGSAVFNILCIVALCGLFGGMVIHLTWWPLFRDTSFYCLSVAALILAIHDGEIHWYEGLIFLLMYALYIVIMYFNERLEVFVTRFKPISKPKLEEAPLVGNENGHAGYNATSDEEAQAAEDRELATMSMPTILEDEYESPLTFPDSHLKRFYWICMLPITVLIMITVPDCRRPGCWRRLFFLTFFMSVLWIAALAYVLVWMVCITGDTLGIPDTVMGLTLLAAGTSVPDAMASIFVARDGYGDMAVSNTVGSNIFDILLCLGLPWLLHCGIIEPGEVININSSGLTFSAVTLLSTVVILFASIVLNKWRLNKLLGAVFLCLYVVVMTFACLYELNIFGLANFPSCERTRM